MREFPRDPEREEAFLSREKKEARERNRERKEIRERRRVLGGFPTGTAEMRRRKGSLSREKEEEARRELKK